MQRKLDINVEKEIYWKKKDGMRTKDILAEYGINKKLLSRIMHRNSDIEKGDSNINSDSNMNSDSDNKSDIKNGDSDMNSDSDNKSDIKNGDIKGNSAKGDSDNKTVTKIDNRDMLISTLFTNIAELCNVVLKQQKRIDTLQQRVESLQTRLDAQMNINHQTEEKTQPETKSDNVGSDVGWDEWEPTQIIHTNHGTEVIRDGKRFDLYKNLFIMDNNDDNNDDTKTATNEPQKQETHEKSKFDVDEDGFCALKPKKW